MYLILIFLVVQILIEILMFVRSMINSKVSKYNDDED